ncbi:Nucleolar protein 12 [Recurvomyces mirabilis]|nr:Nucleolar protein 12 [Recurvomyces mirabilis]
MAEKMAKIKGSSKVEKTSKKEKSSKKDKKVHEKAATQAFSLLAADSAVDAALSSLFSVKTPIAPPRTIPSPKAVATAEVEEDDDPDVELDEQEAIDVDEDDVLSIAVSDEQSDRKRKRKRKDADEDMEAAYMTKLAREEEREAAKRRKQDGPDGIADELSEGSAEAEGLDDDAELGAELVHEDEASDNDDVMASPPPKHETLQAADDELSKANRTVFLGNVSTSAISSKSARRTLIKHLESFLNDLKQEPGVKPKLESLRFRSTPYAPSIPKKAAYARKEVMDTTTKSSNAYAVYSTNQLAREAAKRLNGTVVLDRHLRVDEIAHPAKVDNRRCIFVGNLGFVDDESNIQQANEDEGREVRKRGKEPGDVEEGLWRTFSKCGTVESVRVIRDSTTRVGKGIAYVQFEDENAVEAALLYNEKKFPPMLPRKLRVSRAKAVKRNVKPNSGRPTTREQKSTGYQRKVSGAESSQAGRVGKLYGKAAAATAANTTTVGIRTPRSEKPGGAAVVGGDIRRPEDFVFEGHRASSKSGKSGLKLGGKKGGGGVKGKGKAGKPTSRSAKRGAAFKAGGKKKART